MLGRCKPLALLPEASFEQIVLTFEKLGLLHGLWRQHRSQGSSKCEQLPHSDRTAVSPGVSSCGGGLLFLPDSPRCFVKRGRVEKARNALSRLRGQPQDSEYIESELSEIIANEEYERAIIPAGSWANGWMNCFRGSVFKSNSNLRKTILGTSLQMMQQWTGINFIFYYSTPFLQSTGAISNTFLISLIFNLVNVCSTPLSFWAWLRDLAAVLYLSGVPSP